jgi:hypothetical protein
VSSNPILPTRNGRPLDFIPFVGIGPRGVSIRVDKPPLLDLVDVNLSHYRNSADLEHGRHFTALPTPYITGWMEPGEGSASTLRIGSGAAWTLSNPESKVGMLEFTGQGLRALEVALDHKEMQMAVLGARLLEATPKTGETAEAVRLRHSGEHAVLGTMTSAVSQGLSKILRWHIWWMGLEPESRVAGVELNRDYFDSVMSPNEAEALMKMWQAGSITFETLYWNLQRGEWARPGVSVEEEKAQLETELSVRRAEEEAKARRDAELRRATGVESGSGPAPSDRLPTGVGAAGTAGRGAKQGA